MLTAFLCISMFMCVSMLFESLVENKSRLHCNDIDDDCICAVHNARFYDSSSSLCTVHDEGFMSEFFL